MNQASTTIQASIAAQIAENPIMLYMKGTPAHPMCGFSARVVQALNVCGEPFGYVDVLEDEAIRQGIKEFSDWPTIPQLYVQGEFIGGCDIILEMLEKGELQALVQNACKQD